MENHSIKLYGILVMLSLCILSCKNDKILSADNNLEKKAQNGLPKIISLQAIPAAMSINDTFALSAQVDSVESCLNMQWEWDIGGTGSFTAVESFTPFTAQAGSDENLNFPCILRMSCEGSGSISDTIHVMVELDPPVPLAQAQNQVVHITKTIILEGSAIDKYGLMALWEWDVGNTGQFINTTPDSDLFIEAPAVRNKFYECVLRVTDDDGNIVKDTTTLEIYDPNNPFGMVKVPSKGVFGHDLWIDSIEVIQDEYIELLGDPDWDSKGYRFGTCSSCPAWLIGIYEAVLLCNERSKKYRLDSVYTYDIKKYDSDGRVTLTGLKGDVTKNGYRLPKEEEWEYAYRAGTETVFYWGNDTTDIFTLNNNSWNRDNSGNIVQPTGRRQPNGFGLYDMSGNISEICWNHTEGNSRYVLRGGDINSCYPGLQATTKSEKDFGFREWLGGVRCVLNVLP